MVLSRRPVREDERTLELVTGDAAGPKGCAARAPRFCWNFAAIVEPGGVDVVVDHGAVRRSRPTMYLRSGSGMNPRCRPAAGRSRDRVEGAPARRPAAVQRCTWRGSHQARDGPDVGSSPPEYPRHTEQDDTSSHCCNPGAHTSDVVLLALRESEVRPGQHEQHAIVQAKGAAGRALHAR